MEAPFSPVRRGDAIGRVRGPFVAALVAVGALAALAAVAADAPTATIKRGLAHVGIVQTRGEWVATQWLGTGFVVDERCTVLTARHVLDDLPEDAELIVRFLDPRDAEKTRTFKAAVVSRHAAADLALVRPPDGRVIQAFCKRETAPLATAEAFEREAWTGQEVWVAGFPVLEGEQPRDLPILRRGIVASSELEWQDRPMLLLDLTGVPGFSGAPVIRVSDGKVLGVVYGPGLTQRVYDFEWATPVDAAILGRLEAQAAQADETAVADDAQDEGASRP